MDYIVNYIFLLIPLSIFIGRAIVDARNKSKVPPKDIIHFEDEVEEKPVPLKAAPVEKKESDDFSPQSLFRGASDYMRRIASEQNLKPARPVSPVRSRVPLSQSLDRQKLGNLEVQSDTDDRVFEQKVGSLQTQAPVPAAPPAAWSPSFCHLSPLKQAVVMAEILGPPKALQ